MLIILVLFMFFPSGTGCAQSIDDSLDISNQDSIIIVKDSEGIITITTKSDSMYILSKKDPLQPWIGTISFYLEYPSAVNVTIFDLDTNRLRTIILNNLDAGRYRFDIVAYCREFKSGIYFYDVEIAGRTGKKKFVLVK